MVYVKIIGRQKYHSCNVERNNGSVPLWISGQLGRVCNLITVVIGKRYRLAAKMKVEFIGFLADARCKHECAFVMRRVL